VDEDRRARQIVIPDAVVDELVMPLPLAGLQVDGDEALAEEPAARAMAAVIVAGRHFDRQVGQTELFIDGDLRPHAGVAGVRPRVALPRVVAEFARQRDGVEDPEPFAGAHVEAAYVAFLVAAALRVPARLVRGADD